MPFQPDGSFKREIDGGWQSDRDAAIKITAVRHDLEDDGFAKGLGDTITRHGTSTITANIPFNGKKITGYASITAGDAASTVVNKGYVDSFKSFTTGLVINGAGPINGFLQFSSPTGVNGIGWATADMSWIGRVAVTNESAKRLAVNDKADGTGSDAFTIDETGRTNSPGIFGQNLDYENGNYRTVVAGIGTLLTASGGFLAAAFNDVVTTVAHQTATLRQFFKVEGNNAVAPGTVLTLDKSASGKAVSIFASMATKLRWRMDLGNATAESGVERVGSDFYLWSYLNAGTTPYAEISINRATHLMTLGGALTIPGVLTAGGQVNVNSIVQSTDTTAILASTAGGGVYLRPSGNASATGQFVVTATSITGNNDMSLVGALTVSGSGNGVLGGIGYRCKPGTAGGFGANWANIYYSSPYTYVYIDGSQQGAIMWQSDYRMKKDIRPLPSMWEKVKTLTPISYSIRDWELFTNDDTPRWGFVAHELQEQLLETAATGHKDEENVVQNPNPWAVMAALTKALQEAMERIEALEAA